MSRVTRRGLALLIAGAALVSPTAATGDPGRSAELARLERAVVRLVNVERGRAGLELVGADRRLAGVAELHSHDQLAMASLSHVGSDGVTAAERVREATSASTTGETVAWLPRGTQRRAREVVRLWMQSPTHRAVILGDAFDTIGVGATDGRLGSGRGVLVTAGFAGG